MTKSYNGSVEKEVEEDDCGSLESPASATLVSVLMMMMMTIHKCALEKQASGFTIFSIFFCRMILDD